MVYDNSKWTEIILSPLCTVTDGLINLSISRARNWSSRQKLVWAHVGVTIKSRSSRELHFYRPDRKLLLWTIVSRWQSRYFLHQNVSPWNAIRLLCDHGWMCFLAEYMYYICPETAEFRGRNNVVPPPSSSLGLERNVGLCRSGLFSLRDKLN